MAIAAKEEVMIKIGTGRPPFSIQKLAALPKDEQPAFQQPTRQQPEKRPFSERRWVRVGSGLLLGGIVGGIMITGEIENRRTMHDALVMDLKPLYAEADSTKLASLAQLCKEYGIRTDDMGTIIRKKIAEKVGMAEAEVLEILKKHWKQRETSSYERTGVSGRENEVLDAFFQLPPKDREKVEGSFKAAGIQ